MSATQMVPAFTFAFQPIVDLQDRTVVAYEALVRGVGGEPAAEILAAMGQARSRDMNAILQQRALETASALGLDCGLNLNLLPRNVELAGGALEATLERARELGFPLDRITMEIIETEIITDIARFLETVDHFRGQGVRLSIDDFGAGFAGLNLLTRFQPDSVKIDMSIVRDIDANGPRQAIVHGIIRTCTDLGIDLVAEGIESQAEFDWCRAEGIAHGQGFYVARPGFESLPSPDFAAVA